jgi:hypothetical protein
MRALACSPERACWFFDTQTIDQRVAFLVRAGSQAADFVSRQNRYR